MACGKGHPLPASGEARHAEIPERAELEKGVGDDAEAGVQADPIAVGPDGESYPVDAQDGESNRPARH